MKYHYHKDGTLPQNGEILVFGSNLQGRHGKGSALIAKEKFGAIYGQGIGRQGMSYGIPTKDGRPNTYPLSDPRATLPVSQINGYVEEFLRYAIEHPELNFFIVRFGCALATHQNKDIAPMLRGAPNNCSFPIEWMEWLED